MRDGVMFDGCDMGSCVVGTAYGLCLIDEGKTNGWLVIAPPNELKKWTTITYFGRLTAGLPDVSSSWLRIGLL